ncbi:MAG: GntR family transcriptional regulator, partial [Polaromonas sp.]|nr:GntR family transcriptional regulator [Polaromonas sp.]
MNLLHTLTAKLQHHRAGLLLLRTYLAIATLLHGVAKLQNGIEGIQGMVTASGLPAFFAYGVLLGEVVAPALLLVGLMVTPAALV